MKSELKAGLDDDVPVGSQYTSQLVLDGITLPPL